MTTSKEPASETELLDRPTLESLVSLGERRGRDLLSHLVELFAAQAPKSFAAMRRAIEEGDGKVLSEAAHSLKGSSRSIGTPRVAALTFELEERGRAGQVEGCAEVLETLETELARTLEALEEFRVARAESPT